MVLSGMLGTDMTFLFYFRFLMNENRGIKAVERFYKYFIDSFVLIPTNGLGGEFNDFDR